MGPQANGWWYEGRSVGSSLPCHILSPSIRTPAAGAGAEPKVQRMGTRRTSPSMNTVRWEGPVSSMVVPTGLSHPPSSGSTEGLRPVRLKEERKHEGNSWIILWMPSFLREWWVPFVIRQRNGCDSLLIITLSVCREVAFIIHSCLCRGTPPLGTTDATRSGREEGGTESPRLSVPRRFQLENVIKIQIIILNENRKLINILSLQNSWSYENNAFISFLISFFLLFMVYL